MSFEAKVEKIESNVDEIHQKMIKVETQVKDIFTALVGDEKFGHNGVVQRVEKLEKFKDKVESKTTWMYGYMAGMAAVVTLVIEYLRGKI